jgi:dTDP-glucose pyrophosphorylase
MKLETFFISEVASIRYALNKLNENTEQILFVVDDSQKLLGSVTDGDIRRYILKTGGVDGLVKEVLNKKPYYVHANYDVKKLQAEFINQKIRTFPIVDECMRVIDVVLANNLFEQKMEHEHSKLDLPVVIMAGGKGTRLDPFTKILPKPLIPVGNRAVIEIIIDEFIKYGIKDFFLTINHKGNMIKAYFEEDIRNININYVQETKPLGTAGSLKMLQNIFSTPFFVSNCDVIIDTDYSKVYDFHVSKKYDLTLVASMVNYKIPYGVCDIENGGDLKHIIEKPEYNFLINTGFYLLNPDVLEFIPDNEFYHITDLIEELKKQGKSVGVYPVSEKAYIDVGQWEEYKQSMKILGDF